ncbi:MarR family winged helix-turn-helix transcriptional regulator [Homoserinimonas sp. A520]
MHEPVKAESMAMDRATALDRDEELLVTVAARLRRLNTIVLGNLATPLTFRQYRTLTRVMGGYTSLGQLAVRANLTLPTVSETVDGLARRGLMETRPSEVDRRAIVLSVTEAGAVAAAAGDVALREVIETLTLGLSEDKRAELTDSLRIVYEAATAYFTEHLGAKP